MVKDFKLSNENDKAQNINSAFRIYHVEGFSAELQTLLLLLG